MYPENQIIKDARVLTEHFIPSRVGHRDGQISTLRDCLLPITHKKQMRNVFLYGPPGSGKTCLGRYVCEELTAHTPTAAYVYVNVWKHPSRFKILLSVVNALGVVLSVHRKGTPTDELLDALRKKAKDRYVVVILDEIDKAEDANVLYDILETANVGLVLISNEATALHSADQRIRSRLSSAEYIEFYGYKDDELADILKDRAEWGLVPGVVKRSQFDTIAEHANGDARVAIDTLRVAAEIAENADAAKITDAHIQKALPRAAVLSDAKKLEMLNVHQKVLYDVISKRGSVESTVLYQEYERAMRSQKLEPMVERTLRKYMDRLVVSGMVEAKGDGRWRTYAKS
ncbi:MAG: orc1/cdc6 family replication initiation protein [Candidatus Aenigmatarchaeota archaeon]|nr:MAG: orc1/cdc6 family replication initiation protein [Candidatus Aenigmarchaeota archaeon]